MEYEDEKTTEEDDELAVWINKCIKNSASESKEWRTKARSSYGFVASDQWTDDEKAKFSETGRIPIVFNRIARTINAVSGMEVQNRQEVRYVPREINDSGVNELLTDASKWARDNCDAEDEESESFQDTLICGMGWTDTYMDYENSSDGKICISRVDPLEMGWDTSAKKRNLDDAEFVWHAKKISKKSFEEQWPDKEPQNFSLDFEMEGNHIHDSDQAKFYKNDQAGNESEQKDITVVRFQWFEREIYYQVQTESGVTEFDEDKFKRIKEYADNKGLKYVKRTKRVYKEVFVNGKQILDQGPCPCKDAFTLRCMTGIRDRNDNSWFGIVELQKDPQRYANKWLTQIVYILSVNSKGGLIAESDAFKNPRKAEEEWSSPDSITWVNPGAIANGKIKEKSMADYPQGLDRVLQYALESINDVPGINLELLGLADRQQAGYLEAQRKQAGVTILAIFFDALRRYRKEQGRVLAYFIKEYISDGRLIRIVGKNGQYQSIPLLRDQMSFEYDIIVDDAPTSTNMKERTFSILSQLVPQIMQMGVPVPPDILDYTPLPQSLVQKWKEMLPDPKAPPPPDPEIVKQQNLMKIKQDQAQLDAQLQLQKQQQDFQLKQQQQQNDFVLEQRKLVAEIQLEREKAIAQFELSQEIERMKLANQTITNNVLAS